MISLLLEATVFGAYQGGSLYTVPLLTLMLFFLWSALWPVVPTTGTMLYRRFFGEGGRWFPALLAAGLLTAPPLLNALWWIRRKSSFLPPAMDLPWMLLLFNLILFFFFLVIIRFSIGSSLTIRRSPLSAVLLVLVMVLGAWMLRIPAAPDIRIRAERPAVQPSPETPNIFILVFDTLRRDVLGLYNNRESPQPAVSGLAAGGVVFEDVWAPAPHTAASHASMLFGSYPATHRVTDEQSDLPLHFPSLSRMLEEGGYVTGAVSANIHISKHFGYDHYFDFVGEPEKDLNIRNVQRKYPFFDIRLIRRAHMIAAAHGLTDHLRSHFDLRHRKIGAESVVEVMEKFVKKNRKRPVFLLGNFMELHWPYYSSRKRQSGLVTGSGLDWEKLEEKWIRMMRASTRGERIADDITDRERKLLRALYEEQLEYLDSRIEDLLRRLRRAGALDHAVVFLVSDHGELFGEGGFYSHGADLSRHLIHVPLVMWWSPGLIDESLRGKRFWPRVSLSDIPHTIIEMVYGEERRLKTAQETSAPTGHSFWRDLFRPEYLIGLPGRTSNDTQAEPLSPYRRYRVDLTDQHPSRDTIPVFSEVRNQVKVLYGDRMARFVDGNFVEGWRSTESGWRPDTLPPPEEILDEVDRYLREASRGEVERSGAEKSESVLDHLRALGYIE